MLYYFQINFYAYEFCMLLFLIFFVFPIFGSEEEKNIQYEILRLLEKPHTPSVFKITWPDDDKFTRKQKDGEFISIVTSVCSDSFKKKRKGVYCDSLAHLSYGGDFSKFPVLGDRDSNFSNNTDDSNSIKKEKFADSPSMLRLSLFLKEPKKINNLDAK